MDYRVVGQATNNGGITFISECGNLVILFQAAKSPYAQAVSKTRGGRQPKTLSLQYLLHPHLGNQRINHKT
jgi:hypothetical protein